MMTTAFLWFRWDFQNLYTLFRREVLYLVALLKPVQMRPVAIDLAVCWHSRNSALDWIKFGDEKNCLFPFFPRGVDPNKLFSVSPKFQFFSFWMFGPPAGGNWKWSGKLNIFGKSEENEAKNLNFQFWISSFFQFFQFLRNLSVNCFWICGPPAGGNWISRRSITYSKIERFEKILKFEISDG